MKGVDPLSLFISGGQFLAENVPKAHDWAKDTFGSKYAFHPDFKPANMRKKHGRAQYGFGPSNVKSLKVDGKGKVSASSSWSKPTNKKQKLGASDVFQTRNQQVIGSDTTLVGDSDELPISMRLSSNASAPNSIKNMLSHINGRGTVSSTWAGQLVSLLDKRSYIFQHFRHRLHDTATPTIDQEYPENALPYIMKPEAANITLQSTTIDNFPMHLHTSSDETFCPINRPALEDMSWNLNEFKLLTPANAAGVNNTKGGQDYAWGGNVPSVKLNWSSGK